MPAYTDTEDKALLIAVFQVTQPGNPTSAQWEEIAKLMGPDYKPGGISQRYSKKLLKMNVGELCVGGSKVPKSASRAKDPTTPKSGKRKAATADEDDEETPAPKKTAAKKNKAKQDAKDELETKDEFAQMAGDNVKSEQDSEEE